MNIHTLSESNNPSYIHSTKKRDGKVLNVSEMEDYGLQYGVDNKAMFSASKLH